MGQYRPRDFPKEYMRWKGIMSRCYNKNNPVYHRYGGRGIKVCNRWRSKNGFSNFINDMGTLPDGEVGVGGRSIWSIDRINNNKGYNPKNCRWATMSIQCSNRERRLSDKRNKLGDVGISYDKHRPKHPFRVHIQKDYNIYRGDFVSLEQAVAFRDSIIKNGRKMD